MSSGLSLNPVASRQNLNAVGSDLATVSVTLNRHQQDGEPILSQSKAKAYEGPSVMEVLLKPPIAVKPHPSTLAVKPHVLHPIMLLPREYLPLKWLDLSNPTGELPASRIYESNVRVLDLEGRLGCSVLLARAETTGSVYVLESQAKGLYVMCKLGSWVDVRQASQWATVICQHRLETAKPRAVLSHTGAEPTITPELHKQSKRKRLAIEEIQSMVKKRPRSPSVVLPATANDGLTASTETVTNAAPASSSALGRNQPNESLPPGHAAPSQEAARVNNAEKDSAPTADDILQSIRTQYFEALYHSKGSLAYFAKGPLSRARAAFHLDCDSNLEMHDLVDFLKSLVMTTVLIDTKYRQSLPDLIAKFKASGDLSDAGLPKSKKRKVTKFKLGKDGLYKPEEDQIRRWWLAQRHGGPASDEFLSQDALKCRLSALRMRETQLQMIMILEILALEPLAQPAENEEANQLPGMESQEGGPIEAVAKKKKARHNLPVLLDVHADRLCIWQSTVLDDVKTMVELQESALADGQLGVAKNQSDPLKDFCVDIILPFFSSRLPEACDNINRKLGGPALRSPPKASRQKEGRPSKEKPGQPTRRAAPVKKERTLDRVLSDEQMRRSVSRGPSGAIALMRSASLTTIPGLKREGSEPLIATIPKREQSQTRPISLFARRESQSSLGRTEDVKAQRKAMVEAELHEAIHALKKPNRALAGKNIAEAAEQRASAGVSQPKKAKRPMRVAGVAAVQVKATPANYRFKDALAAEAQKDSVTPQASHFVPSSSSVIPSTAMRNGLKNIFSTSPQVASTPPTAKMVQGTPAPLQRAAAANPVPALKLFKASSIAAATPVKGQARSSAPAAATLGTQKGRLAVRNSAAQPPLDHDEMPLPPSTPGFGGALEDTPIKTGPPAHRMDRTPLGGGGDTRVHASPAKRPLGSIYQQLGWDDDVDLDDLA